MPTTSVHFKGEGPLASVSFAGDTRGSINPNFSAVSLPWPSSVVSCLAELYASFARKRYVRDKLEVVTQWDHINPSSGAFQSGLPN